MRIIGNKTCAARVGRDVYPITVDKSSELPDQVGDKLVKAGLARLPESGGAAPMASGSRSSGRKKAASPKSKSGGAAPENKSGGDGDA